MRESPEPVLLYIPLMKELGLSWNEIKNTPRVELEGLLCALAEYQQLHSLDGYDEDDINKMAKQKTTRSFSICSILDSKTEVL